MDAKAVLVEELDTARRAKNGDTAHVVTAEKI
jgi:hypothetical protein